MLSGIFRLTSRSLRDLAINRRTLILTLAAITLVVFLAGLFLLLLNAMNDELGKSRGEALFQVYWKVGENPSVIANQIKELEKLPGLEAMKTFNPDQGLAALAKNLSNEDMSWLKNANPIPYTVLLSFNTPDSDSWSDEMQTLLRSLAGVEKVHYNSVSTEFARAWSGFSHKVIWPVIIFLGLLLALIVGNTIKLALLNRQHEIEIYHLVGAKNWFILFPLLLSGAIQGFCGGVLALFLLKLTQMSLRQLLDFPPLSFKIEFLPFSQCILLLLLPALVGVVGSWVAAKDYKP